MTRSLPALASLLVAALPLAAKSPLTHERMWTLKRVGAPIVSPDGKWVAAPVTEPAYDAKDQSSDLWLFSADGTGAPRRLTATKGAESGVSWSADSRRIVFTARREGDEEPQVYLLDISLPGEAQRMTRAPGGASTPRLSPDGKHLLYQSQFDPLAAERKSRRYNARVYDSFPIRNWDRWLDEKRPHLFVQTVEGGEAKDLLAGTRLAAMAGFDGQPSNSGGELQAVWAPDGKSVVFVATTNRNAAAYAEVITDLWEAPAAGGEPRRLTDGKASYSSPAFSPDGKALYAQVEEAGSGQGYSLTRLARWSWPGPGPARVVTGGLDRSVTSFGIAPDNRTVYALAEEHGNEKLFVIAGDGSTARRAFDLTQGVYSNLQVAGGGAAAVLVANFDSAVNPPEVVRLDPAQGRHTALTRFNDDAVADIDWLAARHFWFTSSRGKRIHSLVFLPPGFDEKKKYPVIVFIHGGPHTMTRDQFHTRWNYHLLTAPGYVVIAPNYTGSTGFGEQFSREIQGDPLKGPGQELNEALDAALREMPFLDGGRVCAGGASYGGHLANWLQATTTRYRCLFSHAGLINLESQWGTSDTIYHREVNAGGPVWEQGPVWREQNPARYAARFRTPILLTVGELDFRVPLNQTIENWSILQRLRIPSRLIVFPDENHWILKGENNRFFFQELHAWLARHLAK